MDAAEDRVKRKKPAGEVKLDISDNFQPTEKGYEKCDLKGLFGYPKNSVDVILANGVLEQMDGVDRPDAMREIHRVLKPGGKLVLQCSMWNTPAASMSPYSKWPPLSPQSFGFYCADVRKRSNYNNPALDDIDFDLTWNELYGPDWQSKSDTSRTFAAKHYNDVVVGLVVTMTKKEVK